MCGVNSESPERKGIVNVRRICLVNIMPKRVDAALAPKYAWVLLEIS